MAFVNLHNLLFIPYAFLPQISKQNVAVSVMFISHLMKKIPYMKLDG